VLAAFRSLPSEAFLLSSFPSKANAKSLRLDQSQTETDCANNLVKLSHEYCAAQDGHLCIWSDRRRSKYAKKYVVTSDDDNTHNPSPGSLRCGVSLGGSNLGSGISSTGAAGAWITFSRDMIISLHDMLWIRSSTTIDGRGFNITIAGK
jgi:hypothetical protein